jgi:hypothetical protein
MWTFLMLTAGVTRVATGPSGQLFPRAARIQLISPGGSS